MGVETQVADLDAGRRVGKYVILTRLSIGGMAELFLAYTSGPGGFRKFVAVKQILPDVKKDPDFVKMFLDEARITAALSHANIGQVFDLGQEDEELYLAMEFISGQNLEQVMKLCAKREKPIPVGLSAMVVRDACLGLHYAHNFKEPSGQPFPVIHRDVSPKNVMVTYDGNVKVIDFGIAKAKGRLGRTQVGIVKGTSGYMSPEQVRGESLDGRSDLFSVAVILHELLSGQRLFTAPSEAAMMLKIAEEEVPSPRDLNPKVPQALSDAVMRGLRKSRGARFATGKEFAKAIEAAAGAELFDEDQAAAFMRELFEEKMKKTRALLDFASKSEDHEQLDAAAGALRDEAEGAKAATPKGRTPRGAQRYASKVANDYALYSESEAATVKDETPPRGTIADPERSTSQRPKIRRPAPEPAAKKRGFPWAALLVVVACAGLGFAVSSGPLRPWAEGTFARVSSWAKNDWAGEPPPPPPTRLLPPKPALPPQAVALIEREKEQAAQPAPPPPEAKPEKELPPLPSKEETERLERKKEEERKAALSGKKPRSKLPNTTATQRPEGEAEVLDTKSSAGAARDGLGWLSLYTVPPTEVFDGATDLGVSPLVKVPLPVGTYRLRLVDPDGQPRMLSAPIKPGAVTSLKVRVSDLPIDK